MSRGARRSAFAFVSQNRYRDRWELSAMVAVGYQLQLQSLDIGMCVGNGVVTVRRIMSECAESGMCSVW